MLSLNSVIYRHTKSFPSMSDRHLVTEIPDGEHHELQDTWTFWYLVPDLKPEANDWSTFLKPLNDFHSVEDFWGIVNSVSSPAALVTGCRYYVFKKGVKPLWEDPQNAKGYQVFCPFTLEEGEEGRKTAQEKWEGLAAAVIGADMREDYYDFINGVEFNCRKLATNVGIWIKEVDVETLQQIKEYMKKQLDVNLDIESTQIKLK